MIHGGTQAMRCSVCGEGKLQPKVEYVCVELQGETVEVESHYSVCDTCRSEQATVRDAEFNKGTLKGVRGA